MLSKPPGGGGSRRAGVILIAGAAAALLGYFALRGGPKATEDTASPSVRATAAPTGEEALDLERPATGKPRPRPNRRKPTARSADPATDTDEVPARLAPADVTDPALKAVLEARDDPSARATKSLIASITSKDEVIVAEATKALVERGATEAIVPLTKVDLSAAAGSGLSIIAALGKLAGVGSDRDRARAVERLIAMLEEEKRRGARESAGNLIQIYEALGRTGDPAAAAPLEAELLDASVPRAPKVVIVASLVQLGQPSSIAALETALATETATAANDALEEEIRLELVGAIEDALVTLRSL